MKKRLTYEELLAKVALLEAANLCMQEQNKNLIDKNKNLVDENKRKQERIAYLERMLFGSKRDKASFSQEGPGFCSEFFYGSLQNKQKCLFVLLLFLLYVPKTWGQHVMKVEQIRHFYDCYMESLETGNRKMESNLLGKFLTPEMQKKKARLTNATDSDPLLRAQDVPEHARQTLTCRHLERRWYEVAYRTYEGNEQDTVTIRIPVRTVEDEKGTLRINYITPYWGESRYGDYLFDIPAQKVDDQSDAFIFVESFFKAYVYPYVILSPTLEQDLEQLRKQNCTSSLQEKYSVLKQSFLEDGEYMDPLIGCADFDVFWYRSIRVESIDSQTFRIRYNLGVKDWCNKIKVKVTQAKERWFLSDIEVE